MDRRVVASAISVMALAGSVAIPSVVAAPVAAPATATRPAIRDVMFAPAAQCDVVTAQALSVRHPGVRQFVIVAADSWTTTTATLQIVARTANGVWRCQQAPVVAKLGKSGSRPLAERRSGDGTTPAGSFPLGKVTAWDGQQFQFFGNRPDIGVRGSYRLVQNEDCWGARPNTASYQSLVNHPGCTSPDEWLTSIGDVYGHAAVIGANLDPISGDTPGEPALAAAIFLHRNSYTASGESKPTSGCVSLAEDDLELALRLIDPGLGVQFAIGELSWLRDFA
jgi:L,D-peptidoglycan transpeptidase YkuD (ErfK/YbiS/YcfS/YnhG family)